MVENFVETVEATLPPEATIVKTIGDEVMVVSPDAASLTEWAVGLLARFPQRPQPRVGIHCGEAVYRDGDYFGTHVNLAHRVVNRAQAGEVLVTDRVVEAIEDRERLACEPIGEVSLKGFPVPTASSSSAPRPEHGWSALPTGGSPQPRLHWAAWTPSGCWSGCGRAACWRPAAAGRDALRRVATRSACSTSRCACSAPRRLPRCTSTTACATTPARTSATARRSARGSGCALEVERPRRPEGPGNLQAWARDARYAAAAAARRSAAGRADRHRPHRRRPGRDDPLPARLLAQPPRAARHASPRRQPRAAAARLHPRADHRLLRGARPGLARRPDQRRRPTPATGSAIAWRRRWPRSTQPPPENVLRTAELLRDEAEVLDALVDAEIDGSNGSARGTITLERLAELPPALRRLVVQRLADRAAGRPVPGAARHADEVAALRRTGTAMLDLGGGVRAVAERGMLHAERPDGNMISARDCCATKAR